MSNFLRDFTQAERGLGGTIVQLTFRPRRVVKTFLFKEWHWLLKIFATVAFISLIVWVARLL
ncbi:hypothetical protein [Neolewinella persica]|uniref:hypothetical protein n=1 Tax=Neolewinella persica TaxID=70998 RepID=UPI0012F835FF|nr:hypothetical protein [Neolewinella persica]